MDFDVYTVGGIEFLSQVYKGVVMTLGDSGYETLLRLMAFFAVIAGVIGLIARHNFYMFMKRIGLVFVIAAISFGIKSNVTIIDTKYDQTYVVSRVPAVPAFVHSWLSTASHYLTSTAQQVFHTGTVNVYNAGGPGENAWTSVELDYNKTGFGGFFEYVDFLRKFRLNETGIKDIDEIYKRFFTVIKECTLNEIALMSDNEFQRRVLLSSNLLQDLRPTVNGFVEYNGQMTSCIDLYDQAYAAWMSIRSQYDSGAPIVNSLLKFLPDASVQKMPAIQAGISEILKQGSIQLGDMLGQAGMIHALRHAKDARFADSDSAANFALQYEVGRNVAESTQMGRSLGLYAKETIPLMKVVFESLTVAFIPIFFLIILLGGGTAIRNSFFSIAVVYMWDPVLATINGIVNIAAIAKVHAALAAQSVYNNAINGNWTYMSIAALNTMYAAMDYIPAVAGYLAIASPGIAYGLVKGGEVTMAGIASMMASPVMSTPIHHEAAASAETQRMADSMGKKFGEIEYNFNSSGQARLEASLYQGLAARYGYNSLFNSRMGAANYAYAQGIGQGRAFNTFGIGAIAGATAVSIGYSVGDARAYNYDPNQAAKIGEISKTMDIHKIQSLNNIVQTEYGGDYSKFAQQLVSSDKATALFIKTGFGGNTDRFVNEYLLPQMERTFGDLKGDIRVFNEMASKYGFKSYDAYRAFVSEIQSRRSFANDAAYDNYMTQLAEKHGLTKQQAYEAVADMEALQTFSRYERFDALSEFVKQKGMTLKDLARYWDGKDTFVFDKDMAKKFGLPRGGKYTFSVDASGKPQFIEGESGREILLKNINLTLTEQGDVTRKYHKAVMHYYGITYNVGNDTLYLLRDGNPVIIARNYSEIWRNREMGNVVVNKIADEAGGFVKILQGIQDRFGTGWRLTAETAKTPLGKIVAALGISVRAHAEGQRDAIERLDANAVRNAIHNVYDKLYYADMSIRQKNEEFTKFVNEIYQLGKRHSTMNTVEQMGTGVENPTKGQGVSRVNYN